MAITCIIRYEIDPYRQGDFEHYARTWGEAIPRSGADLLGYFAPHEGSLTTAYGIYTLPDLASYETYRQRLAQDPLGRRNYEFARQRQFIRSEERLFTRPVSGPHAPGALG
ncbi:NIPSNAP family protein [Pseudactinotalea sp. Z1732]|uniref:NIPSNAP family protein n=1 Tax=Micrococcales TaxID=85006 RepID=UPI003C7B7733